MGRKPACGDGPGRLLPLFRDHRLQAPHSHSHKGIEAAAASSSFRPCALTQGAAAAIFCASVQQRSHLERFAALDEAPPPAPEETVVTGGEMVDYMLGQPPPTTPGPQSQVSFDKLTFSDVLQFADFGPKLALNQPAASDNGGGGGDAATTTTTATSSVAAEGSKQTVDAGGVSESTTLVQQADGGGGRAEKAGEQGKSGRRKRPRTVKTSEEVESQRMTHIAVERNRRRQMNEYLRVLRSLMPGSYVQRGDQASIIGGAIEFIRELEQLIQCLESQKRRRLATCTAGRRRSSSAGAHAAAAAGVAKVALDLDASGGGEVGGGVREEMAENKSCVADIEVRVVGVDAMIKILSRRRPGQLIKTVAALEEMHMSILHTNITTIDQTVLYSFNVKIAGDARFSAEDIAGAVHQILSFIDVNYTL
uniref:BHLH domain-containing protein n=1 Tax=Oryza barthii TaxID=65489 RepID=A0A0D3GBE1_9ORYZ